MPMPTLDPSRFVAVVLADPTHKLPLPDKGGRMFLAGGETVDVWNPFYAHLIADGSLRPRPSVAALAETPSGGGGPTAPAATEQPPHADPDAAPGEPDAAH